MATFRNGILGGFRGTIGTAIGTSWRKQDVIRSRHKVKKKKRKDTAQTLKLALVSEFLAPFSEVIRLGHHNRKVDHTASTIAKKYHLAHAVKGEMPDFKIDYTKVVLSKGNREKAWAARVEIKNTRTLRLTWEVPVTADTKLIANDEVHVIIYRELRGTCAHLGYGLTRDMLTYDKKISNIDYIGTVTRKEKF